MSLNSTPTISNLMEDYLSIFCDYEANFEADGTTMHGFITFAYSVGAAPFFLIYKIAIVFFSSLNCARTFGRDEKINALAIKDLKAILACALTIPVGFFGICFPGTVTRMFYDNLANA